ncbi:hypothetical protein BDV93DRAFT_509153 [Ceratobasidium sp. AG-I]|nr:hypothetical protein BDV93DRAFT_509153 [Ceratobasidium sp. AG-I]
MPHPLPPKPMTRYIGRASTNQDKPAAVREGNEGQHVSKKAKLLEQPNPMGSRSSGKYQVTKDAPFSLRRIPVVLLFQIASCLRADDVLALARTSKLFRMALMNHASVAVWRAAISNTEKLPQCPETISEPRYVAVIFATLCFSCGIEPISTKYNSNKNSIIRLCETCGKAEYGSVCEATFLLLTIIARRTINWRSIQPVEVQGLFQSVFALRSDVDKEVQLFQKIKASGNQEKLNAWRAERFRVHASQNKFYTEYLTFKGHYERYQLIDAQKRRDTIRQNKHIELSAQMETRIKRRLIALGWTEQDLIFPRPTRLESLKELNHDTPFTERHWKKIKPKIIAILENNRVTRPVWEKEERRDDRHARLQTLWETFKISLSSQTGPLPTSQTLAEAGLAASRLFPVPEFPDVKDWPIIKKLIETDVSVTEMEASFAQRHIQIYQEVFIWGGPVKAALADVVRQGLAQSNNLLDTPIVGTIAGHSTSNPFSQLSPEMQLLIRADTLFDGTYSPPFCSYDTFIHLVHKSQSYYYSNSPLNTTQFKCHPTAPAITRTLLKNLGRPTNTSLLELQALDERFVCGRCQDTKPKTWLKVVQHYVTQGKRWEDVRMSWFVDRNIAFHDLHALESDNPKPLIRILGTEEQSAMGANASALVDPSQVWLIHELSNPELEAPNVDLTQASNKYFGGINLYEIIINTEHGKDGFDDEESWLDSRVISKMRRRPHVMKAGDGEGGDQGDRDEDE